MVEKEITFGDEILRLIDGSYTDYVSNIGNVYSLKTGQPVLKAQYKNKNGYMYVGINVIAGGRTKRVHRLVALAFLPEIDGCPIVGHKNNIKTDNRVSNLYWTNVSENTQKAYDDGLAKNSQGIDDSQSTAIACYTKDGVLISVYGSICQAGRCIKGFPYYTIARVVDSCNPSKKGYVFKTITKEEYFQYPENKRNVEFEVRKIIKHRTKIKVTSWDDMSVKIFESQKQAERELGIAQGNIFWALKTKKPIANLLFERVL